MEPGGGTEDPAVTFACVLHNVDEKGGVAAMSTHQVKAIESALNQHIDHCQPEVFEGTPARVHRRRERGTMGAASIRHTRHSVTARRQQGSRALGDGFYNDRIHREGQVISMLLRVTDGK